MLMAVFHECLCLEPTTAGVEALGFLCSTCFMALEEVQHSVLTSDLGVSDLTVGS